MRIHFLGIAGTFMTGIALLAKSRGDKISGMDENIYPPMSDILADAGIDLIGGYDPKQLPSADLYVIGNVMRRGMPIIEKILNERLPYTSAPAWLARQFLRRPNMQTVCAIAGTHGKTTTSAILAHLCIECGLDPGYLIGGKAKNLALPAEAGAGNLFVLEADEYDSAFFDKRSKFIHYRPDILVINNLEYDHADIFPDMASLLRQFRHLLRTVPQQGHVIYRHGDPHTQEILAEECHAKRHRLCRADELPSALKMAEKQGDASLWSIASDEPTFKSTLNAEQYILTEDNKSRQTPSVRYELKSELTGAHNADNLLAALASFSLLTKANPVKAVASFSGLERRLQSLGFLGDKEKEIRLISDFAHHPTAIRACLQALQDKHRKHRLLALVVLASNSMRLGAHKHKLADATADADEVIWFAPGKLDWDPAILFENRGNQRQDFYSDLPQLAAQVCRRAKNGDKIVIMSNGSLTDLLAALRAATP